MKQHVLVLIFSFSFSFSFSSVFSSVFAGRVVEATCWALIFNRRLSTAIKVTRALLYFHIYFAKQYFYLFDFGCKIKSVLKDVTIACR